jgi:DNA-binding MltR family transcriptional regulator
MASALKKLLKAKPTADDVKRALKELDTDGPRGTIVLGHALIEDAMRSAIAFHMRTLGEEEYNQLFRGTSPLSSMSAMTRVAFAFKIIGTKVRDDLDRLRELRNAFAHAQVILTFESEPVLAQLKHFECLKTLDASERDKMDGRRLFRAIIRLYLVYLLSKINPALTRVTGELIAGFDD